LLEHLPTFSFIIPVKPGGTVKALEALHSLESDPTHFEILIAEGCKPSLQRNRAAQEARGEILYFLDDDSRIPPNALGECAPLFDDENVAALGGPSLTPADDTPLQKLFGLALSSLFGAGGMRNRYRMHGTVRTTSDKELIMCNLAMRRDIFLDAGGLDERLYPNEENELLDRILASGKSLLHVPHLAIRRSQRSTLQQFARQMFSYGRGRAQQTLIAGGGSPIGFIPLFFLIYLFLMPVAAVVPQYAIPLYCYIFLDIIAAAIAMVSSGSVRAILLIALFPLMHISNGLGLLCGLIGGKDGLPPPSGNPYITIRRIKEFSQREW
jgi:hypothetical protein